MALKAVLDGLDDVQDELKPYYQERDDGKFVLQVEGINQHPEVSSLSNAYKAEKEKRLKKAEELDELKAKYAGIPEDFDPEAWEKAKKGQASDLPELRRSLEAERDNFKARAEAAEAKVYGLTVEATLDDALKSNGITTPAYQKAARALLKDAVKLDDDGKAVIETDMGPQPIGEYVKRWVSGDEGKAFVAPAKGGGAGGSTAQSKESNPWAKDSFNLTEQGRIARSNPELAARLKQEAGA